MSQSRFSQLSKYTGSSLQKSALKYNANLNLHNLSVITENQELAVNANETSVPFEVAKLSIEQGVLKCISDIDPSFF